MSTLYFGSDDSVPKWWNFKLIATKGTASFLNDNGLEVTIINKVKEGSPHIVNLLLSQKIDLVINTTKTQHSIRDSYSIRRTSLMNNIPYYTTMAGAKVAVDAIEVLRKNNLTVTSLQSINWYLLTLKKNKTIILSWIKCRWLKLVLKICKMN